MVYFEKNIAVVIKLRGSRRHPLTFR